MANHKEEKTIWNGDVMIIHEGQILTGRKALTMKSGIPSSTVEDILKVLERQHQIRQQKTTKFRLITIIKWCDYQKSDSKSDNKATTKRHKQEEKECKEEEIASPTAPLAPFSLNEEIGKLKKSPQRHIQLIGEYLDEIGFDCDSKPAFDVSMNRHLRDAATLSRFTDDEIGRATDYAVKEYKKIGYTLGTLVKIITSNLYAKK